MNVYAKPEKSPSSPSSSSPHFPPTFSGTCAGGCARIVQGVVQGGCARVVQACAGLCRGLCKGCARIQFLGCTVRRWVGSSFSAQGFRWLKPARRLQRPGCCTRPVLAPTTSRAAHRTAQHGQLSGQRLRLSGCRPRPQAHGQHSGQRLRLSGHQRPLSGQRGPPAVQGIKPPCVHCSQQFRG